MTRTPRGAGSPIVFIAALTASASLAGACGGSSPMQAPIGSPESPQRAERNPVAESARGPRADRAPVAGGSAADDGSAVSGYDRIVGSQSRWPKRRFSPCNLVTRSQVEAIVGESLAAPIEAPQGPTCIYRRRSGKALITLAMQSTRLEALAPQLKGARRSDVGSRTAYCATRGQAVLYVGLPRARVLTVVAPCDVARRLAMRATARLVG